MLVVGLLLLAAAVAVGGAGIAANTGSQHQLTGGFDIFGYHAHGSAGRLMLAGIVIGAVAMLGLMMVADGLRRNVAVRRELTHFRRDARARRRTAEPAKAEPELKPATELKPASEPKPKTASASIFMRRRAAAKPSTTADVPEAKKHSSAM
ncbi:MAG: hypothetical protein ACRDSS_13325 [Actinocrinis sp.]